VHFTCIYLKISCKRLNFSVKLLLFCVKRTFACWGWFALFSFGSKQCFCPYKTFCSNCSYCCDNFLAALASIAATVPLNLGSVGTVLNLESLDDRALSEIKYNFINANAVVTASKVPSLTSQDLRNWHTVMSAIAPTYNGFLRHKRSLYSLHGSRPSTQQRNEK
jgi:hypothetical protein